MPTCTYYFDSTPAILSSVLTVMIRPKLVFFNFMKLSLLSSVSENVFSEIRTFLSSALTTVPNLRFLTLWTHNSFNSLPQCSNEHMELLGKHCPELSFNKNITGKGLRNLVPTPEKGHPSCIKL